MYLGKKKRLTSSISASALQHIGGGVQIHAVVFLSVAVLDRLGPLIEVSWSAQLRARARLTAASPSQVHPIHCEGQSGQ